SSHQSSSALCESFGEARMIRKKSGQVVKSSLKSSRSSSSARGSSLSVVTLTQASKSEPNTPTSKAVHFDAKLEHVKLFLAEQKPLAVSRDGSPTDDTSGTDSDFPRFIFDDAAAAAGERSSSAKRRLVMQVANMPARRDPAADVALEELCLAPDGASIQGKVRVRNLAFAKWIAVRFTFDSWQTTSEVTGRYVESLGPLFDRFAFTIRLNDLLARIEGKTLIVAVRYSVEGREVWDNNAGQNYVATFTKGKAEAAAAPTAPMMMTRKMTTLSDDEASSDMMDLRSKLEKVVNTKERTGPAFVAQQARGKQLASAPADADATSFRSSTSFASRYDFAASLKSSWNPDAHVSMHSRTQSFPLTTHAKGAAHGHSGSSSSVAWPQRSPSDPSDPKPAPTPTPTPTTVLGSPRDIGDDASFHAAVSSSRSPLPLPSLPAATTPEAPPAGYFDLPSTPTSAPPTSAVKRTPPGTPRSPGEVFVPSPRFNSFPPLGVELTTPAPPFLMSDSSGDSTSSELSTPSMVTPSSSRESTPEPESMSPIGDARGMGMFGQQMSPETHYRQFLSKFCFFTGPGSAATLVDGDEGELLPRTHSASDIEEFLTGLSPNLHQLEQVPLSPYNIQHGHGHGHYVHPHPHPHAHAYTSPSRSSSLDDLTLNRSGSLTPTVSRLALAMNST
ncbi:putative phosphatase regulatory subunit-domain-containing protein, partial [Flammula alnicola]